MQCVVSCFCAACGGPLSCHPRIRVLYCLVLNPCLHSFLSPAQPAAEASSATPRAPARRAGPAKRACTRRAGAAARQTRCARRAPTHSAAATSTSTRANHLCRVDMRVQPGVAEDASRGSCWMPVLPALRPSKPSPIQLRGSTQPACSLLATPGTKRAPAAVRPTGLRATTSPSAAPTSTSKASTFTRAFARLREHPCVGCKVLLWRDVTCHC